MILQTSGVIAAIALILWVAMLRGLFALQRAHAAARRMIVALQDCEDRQALNAWLSRHRSTSGVFGHAYAVALTIFEVELERSPDRRGEAEAAAQLKFKRVSRRAMNALQRMQTPVRVIAGQGPYYVLGAFSLGLLCSVFAPYLFPSLVLWELSLALLLVGSSLVMGLLVVLPALLIAPLTRRAEQALAAEIEMLLAHFGRHLRSEEPLANTTLVHAQGCQPSTANITANPAT